MEQEVLNVCKSGKELQLMDQGLAEVLNNVVQVRPRTITINAYFLDETGTSSQLQDTFDDILIKVEEKLSNQVPQGEFSVIKEFFSHTDSFKSIRALDTLLCGIANSDNISLPLKTKLFDAIKGGADRRLKEYIKESFDNQDSVPEDTKLPVSASYILNLSAASERLQALRDLKKQIKGTARECRMKLPEGSRDSAWDKYHPVKAEIQEPLSELRGVVKEEMVVDNVNVIMAQMQLLRIYREYINTQIAKVLLEERIAREQVGSYSEESLRIGKSYSPERMRNTRRLARFSSLHFGQTRASDINPAMERGNLVAADPRTGGLLDSGGYSTIPVMTEAEAIPSMEHQQRLSTLKEYGEDRLDSNTYRLILERILGKLGLLSPSGGASDQIDAYLEARKGVEYHTYTVYVKDGARGLALNNRYNLFILPQEISSDLAGALSRLAHEVAHMLQRHSRRLSVLTILKKFPSVGRSGVLADAGAMKVEALVLSLFDRQRAVNRYHYDILVSFIRGGNFWNIFNVAYKSIRERELQLSVPKSKKAQISSALKVVMRLYNKLGAPGDQRRPEGRYPTDTSFLRYLLQAFTPYSDVPFYISGIPSNELGLKLQAFIPTPKDAANQEIDERVLLGVIIDSAYEVLEGSI